MPITKTQLAGIYRDYIACLNRQHWLDLERFVDSEVKYNDLPIGITGYREMLQRNFMEIPDLCFNVQLLTSDPPYIASRLSFNCAPRGEFLGLNVGGRRASFTENVFYEFAEERIAHVWSVIDRAAIEAQLQAGTGDV